ncbi:MAG: sugar phosphate isomerase/epimerase [Deltaproteobacteria bacterium]
MTTPAPEIHVNIPFRMLYESYLDRFINYRLNPEIGFDAEALDRYQLGDIHPIAERLHGHGLSTTLHGPFMDLSPGSPDPDIRSITQHRFEQLLRLVPIFRPRSVVCHAGYEQRRYWPMWDAWVEQSHRIWAWLGSEIRDQGSVLVLENVYEETPRELKALLEDLTEQAVGFCLDTGHQSVFSAASIPAWIETMAPYLVQLHLHDNTGQRDDHLAMGAGTIDFQGLFNRLKAMEIPLRTITLEPHEEAALQPSLTYLEDIWPW